LEDAYFLNILRPNPARPTKPEPISMSVAGSGTGLVSGPSAEATGAEVKLFEPSVLAGSSDEGQPTIPKNIIITHKTINNFFTFPPLFYKNPNITISKTSV